MPEDFHRANLRGRTFKSQDLIGADFSYVDIQGANFTDAILIGTNFSHAQAGLQRRWLIFWLAVSVLLTVLSGFSSAIAGLLATISLTSNKNLEQGTVFAGVVVLFVLLVFGIVTIRKGFRAALGTVAMAVAMVVAVAIAEVMVGGDKALAAVVAFFMAMVVAIVVAVAVVGAVAVTLARAVAGVGAVVGSMVVLVAIAVVGTGVVVRFVDGVSIAAILPVAVAVASLSSYIGWRALVGDEKFAWIQKIAVVLAAIGGTSFRGADLTDANFTQATLKSTDLRGANVTRTCWFQAKKLDLVPVGESYLKYPQVRQLVITGVGQDQNFDGLPLPGINLQKAKLADASFIGTNLNQANLQDADLSRAKLKQTQLDGAELTGACLTGAYIEDWGITGETKLYGVRCEYVYMRLPTKDDPDPCRKPDNKQEVFEDGDFADFIKPIVDTLDLYHNQGVDPRAIAISFKQLAENNPEAELEIVAMEKRGQDKFLLRAKTAEAADRSQLSAEYFETYNHLKSLPENHVRLLLAEKDIAFLK